MDAEDFVFGALRIMGVVIVLATVGVFTLIACKVFMLVFAWTFGTGG